jgi:hypothetical protein
MRPVLRDGGVGGNGRQRWPANEKPRREAAFSKSKQVKGGGDLALIYNGIFPHSVPRDGWLWHHLAVQADVEAFDLDGLTDPDLTRMFTIIRMTKLATAQSDDGGGNAIELGEHLACIAFQQAGFSANGFDGKDAREQSANDAAYGVDAEHIERVVIAQRFFDRGGGEEATDTGRSPDPECAYRSDKAGRRRNGDRRRRHWR